MFLIFYKFNRCFLLVWLKWKEISNLFKLVFVYFLIHEFYCYLIVSASQFKFDININYLLIENKWKVFSVSLLIMIYHKGLFDCMQK